MTDQLYQIPVLEAIFNYIQLRDQVRLCRCNKRLYQVLQSVCFWNGKHCNLLAKASKSGNSWLVKILLGFGAANHRENHVALIHAAVHGHLEIVKLLLDAGVDIHINTDNALREAALYKQWRVVKYLVERGADIHTNKEDTLHYTAITGNLEMTRFLLQKGAYVKDFTLEHVAGEGYPDVVRLLLNHAAKNYRLDYYLPCCFKAERYMCIAIKQQRRAIVNGWRRNY